MLNPQSLQLRVGVDVGSQCHSVAVGLTDGSLLEEFEIPHTAAGFGDFFARIEGHAKHVREKPCPRWNEKPQCHRSQNWPLQPVPQAVQEKELR